MNDRDFKRLVIGIGLGFLGLAVINSIFQAGFAAGGGRDGGTAVSHYGGFGFFPFPPLLLIGIGLILFFAWRRRWDGNGPGSTGRGPGGRPPRMFEEWHRRAHEAWAEPPAGEGGPAGRRDGEAEGSRPEAGSPEAGSPEAGETRETSGPRMV